MKKNLICAAALLALAAGVSAQEVRVRPLIGGGLTFGGDSLATVTYTDGSSATLHAGGLVHLYAGVDLQFNNQISAQLNVGYHVDNTTGSNGSLKFDRVPVELLGHFFVNDAFRLGGGVRFVSGAKVSGSGVLSDLYGKFDSAQGLVFEGEYFVAPNVGIKARFVSEEYKYSNVNGSGKVDGSHGGIYGTFYFN